MDVETASALDRLSERIDALDSSLRAEIAALREDIRFVAEAVAGLSLKIDSLRR